MKKWQIQYIKLYLYFSCVTAVAKKYLLKQRHDNIFRFYSLTFYEEQLTGVFLSAVKDHSQLCI